MGYQMFINKSNGTALIVETECGIVQNKYRAYLTPQEIEEVEYWTQNDIKDYLKTSQSYQVENNSII